MKQKIMLRITMVIILASIVLSGNLLSAQSNGTLTFSVTTTASGGYSPKHIIAIWIENSSNTFVKTKLKLANTQVARLILWNANSGGNTIDATTGSTQTSHTTRTIVWNGTNVSGSLVPDGTYNLWVEMAWGNNSSTQKASTSISFIKADSADHQTPANTTNFSSMTLDWVPIPAGVAENTNFISNFNIFPNPISENSTIRYTLKDLSDVTITLHDITGKLVKVLHDANQNAGTQELKWNTVAPSDLKAGIYFVKINTGNSTSTQKVLISQ